MKKSKKLMMLCLMSFMMLSSSYAATTAVTKPVVLNKFLQFVLTAQTGRVSISDKNGELQLKQLPPTVTYFTNRPRRIVSTMPIGFYLKRWIKPPPHDFKTTPPNAAIVFTDPKTKKMYTNVVILKNPQLDTKTNLLKFDIQLLNSSTWEGPKDFQQVMVTMAEVTVCGTLGSWGNLPGEPQTDVNCHETLGKQN